MIAAVIVLCLLIAAGIAENALHQRALRRIPLRILVNGTRGKTTVTRMVAAVLNAAGIRAYAKTTGSEARWLMPDGTQQAYRRERRPVSMLEQLPFVRLAVKGGAQAIVVECMAQREENQLLMAQKLVRPHYVMMTNAFVDHVEEIGATEEETVRVLAQSIPQGCCVIANDERFRPFAGRLLMPEAVREMPSFEGCPFPVHPENVRLVMTLAQQLGISYETACAGIRQTVPDLGMYKEVEAHGCRVRNAFAANDPVSFAAVMEECSHSGPYTLLYNHRADRAYRAEAFVQVIRKAKVQPVRIGVIGEDTAWCVKYMRRITGLETVAVENPLGWLQACGGQVLCAGNIKGQGALLLEELIKEAQKNV